MGEALISRRGGGGDLELVLNGTKSGESASLSTTLSAGRYLMVIHHQCGSYNYGGYSSMGYLSTVGFKTDGANSITVESQYKGIQQQYTSGNRAYTQTVDSTTTTTITCSMSSGSFTAQWASECTSSYINWYGHVYLLYKVK